MRYDALFRSDWARCFNDHREALIYVSASGFSGALSGAVFENYSNSDDAEGGRTSTVSISVVFDRVAVEAAIGRPRHGDTIAISGTTYRVNGVDADPAAYTVRGESTSKQERTPGQSRRTT